MIYWARPPQPFAEPVVDGGILGPDGAGFEAAGEEGAVGVSNDRVDEGGGGVGLGAEEGFGPFEGFVVPVAGPVGSDVGDSA